MICIANNAPFISMRCLLFSLSFSLIHPTRKWLLILLSSPYSPKTYTRWPIAWHRTVSVQHHTLLVYEGNWSHVIKNMAACWRFILWFCGFRSATVHFDHVITLESLHVSLTWLEQFWRSVGSLFSSSLFSAIYHAGMLLGILYQRILLLSYLQFIIISFADTKCWLTASFSSNPHCLVSSVE